MSLKRDLTDDEFEALSITKKKRYVARLLIERSKAKSVPLSQPPLAIVMAGVPGAGKTEFLDTFLSCFKHGDLRQERLLKFVADKKNVEKAAEGSMDKRIKLFNRAKLKKSAA